MKKYYMITQRIWIRETNTYSEPKYLRAVITNFNKVGEWLSGCCDYLIEESRERFNEEVYLQYKEYYTKVKECFEEYLKQCTEETLSIGSEIYAYGFEITCGELIE
jgi:hypothetical protein